MSAYERPKKQRQDFIFYNLPSIELVSSDEIKYQNINYECGIKSHVQNMKIMLDTIRHFEGLIC